MTQTLRYFDYAATTPADSRVISAMTACLGMDGVFGNPASSSHAAGANARNLVEQARAQVAQLIGASPAEIVWTSGATESNNLALKGFMDATLLATGSNATRRHVVTSALEHKAILDTAAHLESRGFAVTYLTPDRHGTISAESVAAALRADTGLVSLMLVNNEIGTLTDIAAISKQVHAAGALLHVDAAQALGKVTVDVDALGVDFLSMSAHKVYGPKGIGALYVRRAAASRLATQMHGGGHEGGLRSGTLATHQIVGMGEACALAKLEHEADSARIKALSTRLVNGVLSCPGVTQNAASAAHIPHTISLTLSHSGFFPFMLSGELALASTSACNSAAGKPSHVLTAMGVSADDAGRTIRISLGRFTTQEDVDAAIACIRQAVEQCVALTV